MQKHEFGIMQDAPVPGLRFDEYEPEKYNCIAVDDDDMMKLSEQYNKVDLYWHTLDVSGKGLAYYGITLIPPKAAGELAAATPESREFMELKQILLAACAEGKFVIHFGI